MEFVTVAQAGDIPEGQTRVVRVGQDEIGIVKVKGTFYAFANICTHDEGPIAEGELEECAIICPRHGARFDLATGAVLSLPAVSPLPVYEVKVEGNDIKVSRTPRC